MHFDFVDRVIELEADRIVTVKSVTRGEEYLQDHFKGFEVLPGVFMLESLVQAARHLISAADAGKARWVLGSVRALRYASFVRPGESLRCEVQLGKTWDGFADFKGVGAVAGDGGRTCCSGRFSLRASDVVPLPASIHSVT